MISLSLLMLSSLPTVVAATYTPPYSVGGNWHWLWCDSYNNRNTGYVGARGSILGGWASAQGWVGEAITLTGSKTVSISTQGIIDVYIENSPFLFCGSGADVVITISRMPDALVVYNTVIWSRWLWGYESRTYSNEAVSGSGQITLPIGSYIVSVGLITRVIGEFGWVHLPGSPSACARLKVSNIIISIS